MHILKIRHYGANGAAPIHLIHVRVRMPTDNKRTTMQHYTISLLEMPSKQLESRRRLSPGATCVTAVRAAPAAPGSPCIRNCLRSPSSTGSPNSEQHFGILNVPNPIRFHSERGSACRSGQFLMPNSVKYRYRGSVCLSLSLSLSLCICIYIYISHYASLFFLSVSLSDNRK